MLTVFSPFSRRLAAPLLALACAVAAAGQTSAATAARRDSPRAEAELERAHEMHLRLDERPAAERSTADYTAITDLLARVWRAQPRVDPTQDARATPAEEALFDAGGINVDLARDLGQSRGWRWAAENFSLLLRRFPSTLYRRNAEWALAEIDWYHLGLRGEARGYLRDFVRRYPADARVAAARRQMRGLRVASPPPVLAPNEDAVGDRPTSASPSGARAGVPAFGRAGGAREIPAARRSLAQVEAEAEARAQTEAPAGDAPAAAARRDDARRDKARRGDTREEAGRQDRGLSRRSREAGTPTRGAGADAADNLAGGAPQPVRVTGLRWNSTPDSLSIIVDLSGPARFERGEVRETHAVYFDLEDADFGRLMDNRALVLANPLVRRVVLALNRPGVIRLVLTENPAERDSDAAMFFPNPARLVVAVHSLAAEAANRGQDAPRQAPKMAARNSPPPSVARLERAPKEARLARAPNGARLSRAPEDTAALARSTTPPARARRGAAGGTAVPRPIIAEHRIAPSAVTPPGVAPPADVAAAAPAAIAAPTSAPAAGTAAGAAAAATPVIAEARPLRDGDRSLTRALGLKIGRIVLDAGHGGHDTGTIAADGLEEKTVVLDVVLRLGRLLRERMGADVIYTRDNDTFIPLQERTAIANRAHADLFVSVHANSSPDHDASGIETYYLNLTHNPGALDVAARENASDQMGEHELGQLLENIAGNDKRQESRALGRDLALSLTRSLGEEDRGVKSAPFIVLIGARMPSVLAEISFLSNPHDAHLLGEASYREKIALALYRGIERYVDSLGGVQGELAGQGAGAPGHGPTESAALALGRQ